MSVIEKYKTVMVRGRFEIQDYSSIDINIPFRVDEIVIKHVSWVDLQFNDYPKPSNPAEKLPGKKAIYLIQTDLITDRLFYAIGGESYNSNLDIRFQTGGAFYQSKYKFKVALLSGTELGYDVDNIDEWPDMYLAMTLEFRKYSD